MFGQVWNNKGVSKWWQIYPLTLVKPHFFCCGAAGGNTDRHKGCVSVHECCWYPPAEVWWSRPAGQTHSVLSSALSLPEGNTNIHKKSLWLTCTFCIAPSTGSESNGHTAGAGLGTWEYKQLCSSPAGHKNVFELYVRAVPHSRGRVSSYQTALSGQGRRFCFPDKRCVFVNRLRGGKTQAHSPAAPPQSTAGQHSETVTNSSGQAKTST